MRGRRIPLIGDSRDVVHDDIEMMRANHVPAHGSQRDDPGRPAFADENCSFFRADDPQLEHVSAILADARPVHGSGFRAVVSCTRIPKWTPWPR